MSTLYPHRCTSPPLNAKSSRSAQQWQVGSDPAALRDLQSGGTTSVSSRTRGSVLDVDRGALHSRRTSGACTGLLRVSMKNIQVIDGADNCVYDIFAAPEQIFDLVFAPGTDVAFVEELEKRCCIEIAVAHNVIAVEHTASRRALLFFEGSPLSSSRRRPIRVVASETPSRTPARQPVGSNSRSARIGARLRLGLPQRVSRSHSCVTEWLSHRTATTPS